MDIDQFYRDIFKQGVTKREIQDIVYNDEVMIKQKPLKNVNVDETIKDVMNSTQSTAEALMHLFEWSGTSQGMDYWYIMYNNLKKEIFSEDYGKEQSATTVESTECDCGKEKFGFFSHVRGCPADQ